MSNGLLKVGECLYRNNQGVYFAWFSLDGKQIKRSLKTPDKELARRRLSELRQKAKRVHGKESANIQFEELEKLWLESIRHEVKAGTYRRQIVCLNQMRPFYKGLPVRSITLQKIEAWKIARGAHVAPRTFNKDLEALRMLLRYAQEIKGIILENPAEKIKVRKVTTATIQIPSKAEFRLLVEQLRKEPQSVRSGAADFTEFLAYSGLRLGEAREVCWHDINTDLSTLLVTGGETGTKNHEQRTIPLFPPLIALLEKLRASRQQMKKKIFDLQDIRQAMHSACRRAGLPRYGHHAMRHFFCSNAIEFGCDFKVIAGWLGHKDGGVLVAKTYGHLRSEHSSAMAKRMTFDLSDISESAL